MKAVTKHPADLTTAFVTASADETARLWNTETGLPIGEVFRGHQGNVYIAEFSPDGQRIVTASYDHATRLWDASTAKPIGEPLRGHEGLVAGVAFSPDGRRFVVVPLDHNNARLWMPQLRSP
jgi:WD40 repeat protein